MSDCKIYVGTYAKYNDGSIEGAWLDLGDYLDWDDFMEACAKLHDHFDQMTPEQQEAYVPGAIEHEFMFQDHEGIPERYISESYLDKDVWEQWVELTDGDRELLEVYLDNVNQNGDLREAEDNFAGTFSDEEDWAIEYLGESGLINKVPAGLRDYIDYKAYARDARLGGHMTFIEHEGKCWVFYNT